VTRRKYLGKSYDISWIPQYIQEFIQTAINNGMTEKELQTILGNAKVCKTIIEQEENEEIKKKLLKEFPESSWFMYPKVKPTDLLREQRKLGGNAYELSKVKIPIEKFLTDSEWMEKEDRFEVTSPTGMRKIVRHFLDSGGVYRGIYRDWKLIRNLRTKTCYYYERIIVLGEVPKHLIGTRKSSLLDKYHHRQRK
jgi:hypothetical protein